MNTTPEPTIVVLTALPVEYAAVRALLRDPQVQHHQAGTLFEVGRTPNGRRIVVLARTGQGNQAAAVIAERAITTFAPQALLFVGVAGALDDDLESGDIVVATKVYGYHGGKDEGGSFLSRPQAWEGSHLLGELAHHISLLGSWTALIPSIPGELRPRVHFKPVAAGEVVLNSRTTPLAAQLHTTYNDAAAIEMESAGIAKAGHLNHNMPVLAIRGISDKADGHKHTADQAGGQPVASANAAAFAIALTEVIPAPSERHSSNTKGETQDQNGSQPVDAHDGTAVTGTTITSGRGNIAIGAVGRDVNLGQQQDPHQPGRA